jgi:hypothetical protein
VEEDDFTIDIFAGNNERLSRAVNFLVPTEVWDNGEVDAEEGSGDWRASIPRLGHDQHYISWQI